MAAGGIRLLSFGGVIQGVFVVQSGHAFRLNKCSHRRNIRFSRLYVTDDDFVEWLFKLPLNILSIRYYVFAFVVTYVICH